MHRVMKRKRKREEEIRRKRDREKQGMGRESIPQNRNEVCIISKHYFKPYLDIFKNHWTLF